MNSQLAKAITKEQIQKRTEALRSTGVTELHCINSIYDVIKYTQVCHEELTHFLPALGVGKCAYFRMQGEEQTYKMKGLAYSMTCQGEDGFNT